MEKIEELTPGPQRMAMIIHEAFKELEKLGAPLIWVTPNLGRSAYGIIGTKDLDPDTIKTFIDIGEEVPLVRVETQTFVDAALQTIARKLYNLFDEQKRIRNDFGAKIGGKKPGKVPRDVIRLLLDRERENHQLIDYWKKLFSLLTEDAKDQGLEVLERDENKYQIYLALEIDSMRRERNPELRQRLGAV